MFRDAEMQRGPLISFFIKDIRICAVSQKNLNNLLMDELAGFEERRDASPIVPIDVHTAFEENFYRFEIIVGNCLPQNLALLAR